MPQPRVTPMQAFVNISKALVTPTSSIHHVPHTVKVNVWAGFRAAALASLTPIEVSRTTPTDSLDLLGTPRSTQN